MSRNLLDQESSPYLLLHKDNPVHWRPWGADALGEAETSGKPILLSIGFTACHTCHVMSAETFSDAATAEFLNENFIPIKVDREERPDIDLLYQTATNSVGGVGGWPLTAVLTTSAEPFFIGTYFPPTDRPGAPSFRTAMQDVLRVYREQPQTVSEATANVAQKLALLWSRDLRGSLAVDVLNTACIRIGQRFDIFFGGLTGTPKFPNMGHVQTMQRLYLRHGRGVCNQIAQTTLDFISMGGIYDHVGGGIHRYALDENWLTPHFEKMLYDNAQYIEALTLSWQTDRNPLYRIRIEETVNWVLREMMVEHGFASSIDSDTDGEEGAYYVWTEAEIDAALAGTFSQKFKTVYGVSAQGNYRGRNILNRLGGLSRFPQSEADETLLAKQREILLAARGKRAAPMRDDKVQADWNGMMIAALATAGAVFRKTAWTVAAMRAFDFVEKVMGDGDRLYHSWRNGKRHYTGLAEDYAHMTRAALALWESTNDRRYLDRAQAWVRVLNEHFWDLQNGGYFQTPDDGEFLFTRARSVFDQFIPSANGAMPAILARLYMATSEQSYRERANAQIEAFASEVPRAFVSMSGFLNSVETVVWGVQIVVIGPIANPKTHELISAVNGRALPTKLLVLLSPEEQLPAGHPAFGKTMAGGQPTAYICQQGDCSQPITNPVTLSQSLQRVPLPQMQPRPQPIPQPVGRA